MVEQHFYDWPWLGTPMRGRIKHKASRPRALDFESQSCTRFTVGQAQNRHPILCLTRDREACAMTDGDVVCVVGVRTAITTVLPFGQLYFGPTRACTGYDSR